MSERNWQAYSQALVALRQDVLDEATADLIAREFAWNLSRMPIWVVDNMFDAVCAELITRGRDWWTRHELDELDERQEEKGTPGAELG